MFSKNKADILIVAIVTTSLTIYFIAVHLAVFITFVASSIRYTFLTNHLLTAVACMKFTAVVTKHCSALQAFRQSFASPTRSYTVTLFTVGYGDTILTEYLFTRFTIVQKIVTVPFFFATVTIGF